MKIVAVSDVHADAITLGRHRYDEVREHFLKAVWAAFDLNADIFVFCGDLCNPDHGERTIRAINLSLEMAALLHTRLSIRSFWLAGNHDIIEDSRGDTTLTPLRALASLIPTLHVIEDPEVIEAEDLRVVALPYTSTLREYNQRSVMFDCMSERKPTLFLNHANVEGIIPGSEEKDFARGRSRWLPYADIEDFADQYSEPSRALILNGHIHDGVSFVPKTSRTNIPIHIIGSIARFTFGESRTDPNFLTIDL